MSSKGLRYFGLVARRVVLITVFTSILVGIIAWETMTSLGVGLWAVVLPAEIAVLSLMADLVGDLGGTCVGYALVTPAVSHRCVLLVTFSF